jgi:hypothetical protein
MVCLFNLEKPNTEYIDDDLRKMWRRGGAMYDIYLNRSKDAGDEKKQK